ncbi:MAG: ABC transporter transmembrane domain-containing protein, partial [Patescibacteria group bacterium]|nr:ABC transporter transmembrane domain-containing protein [Patescibacteria group bacterium]
MVNPQKVKTAGGALFKVFKKYKWRFVWITILGFLSGLSAAVGIGTIIPVFSILVGQGIPEINFITQFIEGIFSFFNVPLRLPFLLLFIISLFIAKGILRFLALYINEKTFTLYEKEMRDDLFEKTLATNWPYLLNHNIGYLEKTLMRDLTVSTSVIRQITDVILWGTSLITYALVAFSIAPHITLITVGFGIVLFFIFNPTLSKIKIFAQKLEGIEKKIAHFVNESMLGSRAIKTHGAEVPVAIRGNRLFEDLRTNKLKTLLYKHAVGSAYEPIGFIFIVGLFI